MRTAFVVSFLVGLAVIAPLSMAKAQNAVPQAPGSEVAMATPVAGMPVRDGAMAGPQPVSFDTAPMLGDRMSQEEIDRLPRDATHAPTPLGLPMDKSPDAPVQ